MKIQFLYKLGFYFNCLLLEIWAGSTRNNSSRVRLTRCKIRKLDHYVLFKLTISKSYFPSENLKVEFGIGVPEVGFVPEQHPPPPPPVPLVVRDNRETEEVLKLLLIDGGSMIDVRF